MFPHNRGTGISNSLEFQFQRASPCIDRHNVAPGSEKCVDAWIVEVVLEPIKRGHMAPAAVLACTSRLWGYFLHVYKKRSRDNDSLHQ